MTIHALLQEFPLQLKCVCWVETIDFRQLSILQLQGDLIHVRICRASEMRADPT